MLEHASRSFNVEMDFMELTCTYMSALVARCRSVFNVEPDLIMERSGGDRRWKGSKQVTGRSEGN